MASEIKARMFLELTKNRTAAATAGHVACPPFLQQTQIKAQTEYELKKVLEHE